MAFFRRRRYRGRTHSISPDTLQGLVVLFLLVVAGVSVFALLDLAGPFGIFWKDVLKVLFGSVAWAFPLYIIFLAAVRLVRPPRYGVLIIGITLLLLVFSALVDTLSVFGFKTIQAGGGYVGAYLRLPLESVVDFWPTLIIILALLVTSIVIIFDITLHALLDTFVVTPARSVKRIVLGKGSSEEVVDDEEDVQDDTEEESTNRWHLPFFTRRRVVEEELGEDEQTTDEIDEVGEVDDVEVNVADIDSVPIKAESKHKTIKYRPIAIDLPLSLLDPSTDKPTSGDVEENKEVIRRTLESFGIKVEMGIVSVGPTVTQYTLKPDSGVKLSAITALHNDLALALAAHPIRIEAPIPGKALVGIEVPNSAVAMVKLRDILESPFFSKRKSNLFLGVGKDVAGNAYCIDLEKMPHLLVAGATGAGKSVALNGIILSLLYQNNPSDLKLILIDPKRVEFSVYKHMPHLLTPIITEVPATVNALKWLLGEMDRRFTVLSESGDRNIQTYNQRHKEKMPYVVLIIDELADIMVSAASEVETSIIRLAQMSRAVGIHLILATQRPSVNVITGLIKANVPARMAFSVASQTDSRTILDCSGAEKLLGRGDLLYLSAEVTKPKRVQGAFVTDEEIRNVVNHLKQSATPDYVEGVTERQSRGGLGNYDDDEDPLFSEAEVLVIDTKKASASFLQRRLKVGYARAARLLDMLEARGIIGPGEGAKPREVLMTREERDMLDTNDAVEEEEVEDWVETEEDTEESDEDTEETQNEETSDVSEDDAEEKY
jgi:S-DNA-T family DNA segregation ATPase FtsK/SpoIIIE